MKYAHLQTTPYEDSGVVFVFFVVNICNLPYFGWQFIFSKTILAHGVNDTTSRSNSNGNFLDRSPSKWIQIVKQKKLQDPWLLYDPNSRPFVVVAKTDIFMRRSHWHCLQRSADFVDVKQKKTTPDEIAKLNTHQKILWMGKSYLKDVSHVTRQRPESAVGLDICPQHKMRISYCEKTTTIWWIYKLKWRAGLKNSSNPYHRQMTWKLNTTWQTLTLHLFAILGTLTGRTSGEHNITITLQTNKRLGSDENISTLRPPSQSGPNNSIQGVGEEEEEYEGFFCAGLFSQFWGYF